MKIQIIATAVLILAVGGCRKSSEEVRQAAGNQQKAQGSPAVQSATYGGECSSQDSKFADVALPGVRTSYDLSDLDFTKKRIHYSDNCQTESMVILEKGKLEVIGKSATEPNALDENFNYQETKVTLKGDTLVTAFNTFNICGITDWAVNVERDVSAQAGGFACPGNPAPRTAVETVLVENDTLFLGDNTDSDVTKGRPATVNRNMPFKKSP